MIEYNQYLELSIVSFTVLSRLTLLFVRNLLKLLFLVKHLKWEFKFNLPKYEKNLRLDQHLGWAGDVVHLVASNWCQPASGELELIIICKKKLSWITKFYDFYLYLDNGKCHLRDVGRAWWWPSLKGGEPLIRGWGHLIKGGPVHLIRG